MVYSVNVGSYKEFENLIYNKDLNISKAVVDKIFDNLETKSFFTKLSRGCLGDVSGLSRPCLGVTSKILP